MESEEEEKPTKGKRKSKAATESDSELEEEEEEVDEPATKRSKAPAAKPLAQQHSKRVLKLKDICAQATIK